MSRPSRDDAFVAAASTAIGGPLGEHGTRHPAWSAMRVVLATVTVAFALGLVLKTPCAAHDAWWQPPRQFANACYSDLPTGYVRDGSAELVPPLSDGDGRFPPPTSSVPTEVLGYAVAWATHVLAGSPDVEARSLTPSVTVSSDPEVQDEAVLFTVLGSLLLLGAALAAAGFLCRTHRGRPFDAMAFAAAPVLVLSGIVGWDLVTVALTAAGMWAWSRSRVRLAGALLGVAIATSLWPVVVLGAFAVTTARAGRVAVAGEAAAAALVAWVVISVPAFLLAPEGYLGYVDHHLDAGPSNGSTWQVLAELGWSASPGVLTAVALIGGCLLVAAVVALAVLAPRRPRVPQVALVLMVGLTWLHREYAPQYALALLCLAVLARPVWRDLLIWQATEAFYFFAIWWHLGSYSSGGGEIDEVYATAILVRLVGQAWLVAMVVRDVLQPWHDPVRADGWHDDPAGGVVDEAPDARHGVAAVR